MKKILFVLCLGLSFVECNSQTVIQMTKEGGVYTVPCKVNGLNMNFIFDTGASDVTISLTEALFMFRHGYLKEENILGNVRYSIANGDIAEGTAIIIDEIEISGLKLFNIKASIIHESTAPLLLGQSAIEKLGKYSIEGSTLIIINTPKNKKYWKSKLENAEKYAHENSIIYLYNKLLPLGLSYARLNKNGVGGYFDIAYGGRFPYDYGNTINNSGSWDHYSSSTDSIVRLNEYVTGYFDVSVGVTKKIFFPLWIYGGLAFQYTKVCENIDRFGKVYTAQGGGAFIWVDYDPILFKNTDQTFWKLSPELGLQFKIDKLSIRTGFIINDGLKAQLGAGILF